MKKSISRITTGFAAVMLLMQAGIVAAAEVKVLCAEAMKPAFVDLARDFERTSGHKVTVAYATAGVIRDRIRGGELADVAIMPRATFDPLVTERKVAADSATRVAQSPLAVAVPAGAPKPDISTVEAFKRTLLAAKSITYPDPTKGGAIGIQAARVIDRLGLTEQLKSKTTLTPAGEFREILAKGQAELAIVQPIAVLNYPGVDLVGPLPAELQNMTDFVFLAGIGANAKEPAAAKALIQFLLSPAAARVIKTKGMEPG
jgi:molybdate transport system substrate-binding protein